MIIDNKIEKAFGRNAVFAGGIFFAVALVLFIAGRFLAGGLIMIASGFVIFTFSGVEIDTEKQLIRQYNQWFGLIKTGRWKNLHAYLGITLIPFSRKESMASWSNRTTAVKRTDYRIFLVNKARKPAFVIKRCPFPEEARDSLDEFSLWLKLPVYSFKKGSGL